MIAAGATLAAYKSERSGELSKTLRIERTTDAPLDLADQLSAKQNALADVNRKQEALAHLQSDFDGVKPDINLICEKLSLFTEIWAQVSQSFL